MRTLTGKLDIRWECLLADTLRHSSFPANLSLIFKSTATVIPPEHDTIFRVLDTLLTLFWTLAEQSTLRRLCQELAYAALIRELNCPQFIFLTSPGVPALPTDCKDAGGQDLYWLGRSYMPL